jgi:hypothetical protein
VQERLGDTLEHIGIGNNFLNIPMTQQLRERTDKWDYMKLKSFSTTKEMFSRMKRQPTEWEKIFVSYSSDKGSISRENNKRNQNIKYQKKNQIKNG